MRRCKGDLMLKQVLRVWLGSALLLCAVIVTASAQESLGDAARAARMQKPASAPGARVYTNENLPTHSVISVSGTPTSTAAAEDTGTATGAKSNAGAKTATGTKEAAKGDSAEDQQKAA